MGTTRNSVRNNNMKLETLISAVDKDVYALSASMNIQSDAIIINQCDKTGYDEYSYNNCKIKCYSFCERGVGLSRNSALHRASGDILLFSDEDIIYNDGYARLVIREFEKRPYADMLLFNVEVNPSRTTYYIDKEIRVKWNNCGRYPAYSMAIRRDKLHSANISFSLLFGGGAKYSNGEDSLFISDCLKERMSIYAVPVSIGKEIPRPSTWFTGYNDKFFFDRGVLYYYLYGKLSGIIAIRFILKYRNIMCNRINIFKAYRIMLQGICEGRLEKSNSAKLSKGKR